MTRPQSNPRRSYGTGNLRVRRGAWYGQWWIGGRRIQRKLGPKRQPGSRLGLTRSAAMERNDWGYNVRLLAHEDDLRQLQRFFGRAVFAFLSASIAITSALLIGVQEGISVSEGMTLAEALGYLGLVVATVLGMRVLVAISRDRVI